MAHRIVELVEDKQAYDIIMLDIRQLSSIADYFIICSTDNERQIKAVIESIDEVIHREFDVHPRIEGTPETGWIILDFGDIVLHVFSADQRDFYRLERLWSKAAPVVVMQ